MLSSSKRGDYVNISTVQKFYEFKQMKQIEESIRRYKHPIPVIASPSHGTHTIIPLESMHCWVLYPTKEISGHLEDT